ncbi:MAG TPA: GNAT family N-acetyltransferase [Polyangiaceae bacterium]|nr:GNAT family N-acetyltransferase [Polyangiaceae bacterium]
MSSLVITSATAADAPRLRLLAKLSGSGFEPEAELARAWAKLWVVRSEPATEALGFALTWRAADEVSVLDLAVDEAWRRRGLARELLHAVLEDARRSGARLVLLEARASNEPALALYRSAGFFVTDVRRAYYSDNGEDAVVMRLELGSTSPESP